MNLIIDVGNTSSKIAIFDELGIIKQQTFITLTLSEILSFSNSFAISASIISSVKEIDDNIQAIISHFNSLFLTHKTAIPIFNDYKTTKTLGKDRLAGIIGANASFPDKNILLIDAGSCITFDFFLERKYCGGRISPGLQMRYNALHTFTNQLPQISVSDMHSAFGKDTNSSIISGVQQGAIDEMDAVIADFREENKNSIVILCGGNYNFFDKHLKNSIFADPFIVLKGLNIILELNAKK